MSKDKQRAYVCGGYSSHNKPQKSCEYYEFETNTWKPLPELNTAKCSIGVCEITTKTENAEDKKWLYCFGGVVNKSKLSWLQ